VNKSLWTSSYAVLMAGLGLLALAVVGWLTEVRGRRRWAAPFVALGVNALALYFLSSLLARALIVLRVGPEGRPLQAVLFEALFASWASPVNASLAYALAYVLLWWGVMWILYRRNVRLRL
jgi:predicted acyltransferase